MARLQVAPEIEFKMEIDLGDVEKDTRDYDVQQFKKQVYAEFEKRLKEAFPEGIKIHTFEFGLDTGWHEELKQSNEGGESNDSAVIV